MNRQNCNVHFPRFIVLQFDVCVHVSKCVRRTLERTLCAFYFFFFVETSKNLFAQRIQQQKKSNYCTDANTNISLAFLVDKRNAERKFNLKWIQCSSS